MVLQTHWQVTRCGFSQLITVQRNISRAHLLFLFLCPLSIIFVVVVIVGAVFNTKLDEWFWHLKLTLKITADD